MTLTQPTTPLIVERALAFGASLAGVAETALVRGSPSYRFCESRGAHQGVGSASGGVPSVPEAAVWPSAAAAVVIVAVAHGADRPELDWWGAPGGTIGNQLLIGITKRLGAWLEGEFGVRTHPVPYHLEKGGIFVKDAAVLAGLGCIGRNNLLVTPGFGPRVRLRALLVERVLDPTGPVAFDPCPGCPAPCRTVCPRGAFEPPTEAADTPGPGRDGSFRRNRCNTQMEHDAAHPKPARTKPGRGPEPRVFYCRHCELSCPAGGAE